MIKSKSEMMNSRSASPVPLCCPLPGHPSVTITGPGRNEQFVFYWSVSLLLLKAFHQELPLSNHTIHLSKCFLLQPVINKNTNYTSKINFCFVGRDQTALGLPAREISAVPSWKWAVLNTQRVTFKREHLLNVCGEWAFHARAQIFSVCLTLPTDKPMPLCKPNNVFSDLILQIGYHSPLLSAEMRRQVGGMEKKDKKRSSAACKRKFSFSFPNYCSYSFCIL